MNASENSGNSGNFDPLENLNNLDYPENLDLSGGSHHQPNPLLELADKTAALAIIKSRAQQGVEAIPVDIEVHLSMGLPGVTMVGLPEKAVKESKERVRSAIINSGFEFPARKIIINLAPADLPKEGGRFDLAIAIGILAASGQIPLDSTKNIEFAGELALDGSLRSIPSALPFAFYTQKSKRKLILPSANSDEAVLIENLECFIGEHLLEVCAHLSGRAVLPKPKAQIFQKSLLSLPDFSEVKGQMQAKRALEIAASGHHNVLFVGPPGTGKSMLASRVTGILPPLCPDEALEVATIASIRGRPRSPEYFYERPFRHPHHTASPISLIGGGSFPKPGELSLAHHGVLFLDELPEFGRSVLEVMREPLETGQVSIARANAHVTFPAKVQLIAAMNPCPCGYATSKLKACTCSSQQVEKYKNKISGPLLDRIDLHLHVPEIDQETLLNKTPSESSASIQSRVIQARKIQMDRQGKPNASLSPQDLNIHCALNSQDQAWLSSVMNKLKLSARSFHRLLKVARTIADLEQDLSITQKHLAEAISLRERKLGA